MVDDVSLLPAVDLPPKRAQIEAPRLIARMLGVLKIISRYPDGASLTELALELSSPKSSLLVLLKAMVATGHLAMLGTRYKLGFASYDLAQTISASRPSNPVLREALQKLWSQTQETAVLVAFDPQARLASYIDAIESSQTVRYAVKLGLIRPLYCTAGGQALLAFQSESFREDYLAREGFERLTPQTLTYPAMIRAKLEKIRADGYAVSIEEAIPGSVGIAAPLIGNDGKVERAMLIAGPAGRLDKQIDEMAQILLEIVSSTAPMLPHRH